MSQSQSKNDFIHGSPLLLGDNTIPGLQLPKELVELVPKIMKEVKDFGCDYYPSVVQMLTYDEMSEVAAYSGFPVRFPHWKWGMEYEELQRGYEHAMFRIYEMVINCLSLDTMVQTQRGTIPAESVSVGDKVRIGSEAIRNVVAIKKQPKSLTKKIFLNKFGKPIVCSLDHKWKVFSENGHMFKTARELVSGDVFVGQDNYSGFQKSPAKIDWSPESIIEETKPNIRHCLKDITIPTAMTLELAELMGAVVGDGSCGVVSRENMISISIENNLEYYIGRIFDLFKTVFGSDPIVEHKESVDVVTYCSKLAVGLFDFLGIPKGCTYKTKRIPHSIWNSSSEYRASFLRGLFDTDGCASDVVSFSCYNKDLAHDVQLMLLEMGITTHYFETENNEGLIYVLRMVGKDSIEKFQERIGFSLEHKQEGLEALVNTGNSTNRGVFLPYVQNMLLAVGKELGITTYSDISIGRSLKLLSHKMVGKNVLVGLCDRIELRYKKDLSQIRELLRVPYYVVDRVEDGPISHTVDIALDLGHEFVASGFVTHNTNPCYIYCLDSNTLVDNVTVVAHALGHCDFFKNNIFFTPTSQNMMNQLANHGTRIRRYMKRWGHEVVTEFIDWVLCIETLIDPVKAWDVKRVKDIIVSDTRTYKHPHRLEVQDGHEHMEGYINPREWRDKQKEKIQHDEAAAGIGIFKEPTKDILGFIRDHAPLKPWQADIVAMLHEESMYFAPQRVTKMLNEGWASFIDFNIMARHGMASLGQETEDSGIIEYAAHKMGVLGGKYSMNPYKLGYTLFCDIEDRWNKGKFGDEYDRCDDIVAKAKWDKKVGLGHEKVFEVRKYYNDLEALNEYFTEEFCNENEFYEWTHYPNGEYRITNRDHKTIKAKLMQQYSNGGLPDIRLADPNFRGKGWMLLQHTWTNRTLYYPYLVGVMQSLYCLWKNVVVVSTFDKDGKEIIFACHGTGKDDIIKADRDTFEELSKQGL